MNSSRCLGAVLAAGLALAGAGCTQVPWGVPASSLPAPEPVRLQKAEEPPPLQNVGSYLPQVVYKGEEEPQPVTVLPQPRLAAVELPISLDTVFRVAEEQNPQIALARERVREAYGMKAVAAARWLPDLWVGSAYYRHEGGIQNEDGTLINSSTGAMFNGLEIHGQLDIRDYAYQKVNAQRKVWQQKGDLSRITYETLLDASSTYVDFLTARTGEAIARDLEQRLSSLKDHAERMFKAKNAAAEVAMFAIQAEVNGQQQTILKLHQQGDAAAAKLIYLLGLDPSAQLLPADSRLIPLDLVDATPPASDLTAKALAAGPGIQEMEGLLNLIQESINRSKGFAQYMPVIDVRMGEGGFGAGANDNMDWSNRWDLGLQARFNLTEFITLRQRRLVSQAKIREAHLAYQDLRGKLAAGVQEAREAILSGRQQIQKAQDQIANAQVSYDKSNLRLLKDPQNTPYSEMLMAIAGLGKSQLNYLTNTNAYNKAQLRLFMLSGFQPCR